MSIQAPKAVQEEPPFDVDVKLVTKAAPVVEEAPKKLTSPEDILAAIRKRQAAKA
jgi:hypothetical protein